MLCSECNKNPAILFYKKIENGKESLEGYCYDCAKKKGINVAIEKFAVNLKTAGIVSSNFPSELANVSIIILLSSTLHFNAFFSHFPFKTFMKLLFSRLNSNSILFLFFLSEKSAVKNRNYILYFWQPLYVNINLS